MGAMYITIGKIVNTHGVRGEVRVKVFSDSLDRFENVKDLYASPEAKTGQGESANPAGPGQDGQMTLTISGIRYHKDMVLLTFEGIPDLTAAEKLKNYVLQVPEADLPTLPDGRYYIYQLVGLSVWEKDVCYGRITDVLQPGSNDVYTVSDGKKEILIPALKTVVKSVDLGAGRMEVELPAGLLEIYE